MNPFGQSDQIKDVFSPEYSSFTLTSQSHDHCHSNNFTLWARTQDCCPAVGMKGSSVALAEKKLKNGPIFENFDSTFILITDSH